MIQVCRDVTNKRKSKAAHSAPSFDVYSGGVRGGGNLARVCALLRLWPRLPELARREAISRCRDCCHGFCGSSFSAIRFGGFLPRGTPHIPSFAFSARFWPNLTAGFLSKCASLSLSPLRYATLSAGAGGPRGTGALPAGKEFDLLTNQRGPKISAAKNATVDHEPCLLTLLLLTLGQATDETFANKLHALCEAHPNFDSSARAKANGCFSIRHYAGTVQYEVKFKTREVDPVG